MAACPPPIFPAQTPSPTHTHSPAHSPSDEDSAEEDTEVGESWDGSTANSSILGTDEALKALIQAKNRPICPSSLNAALLSLSSLHDDAVGSGTADGEEEDDEVEATALAGSGAGSGAAGPDAGSALLLMKQPSGASMFQPPDQLLILPSIASLATVEPSLEGSRPAADPEPVFVGSQALAKANSGDVPAGPRATATSTVSAAAAPFLPIDRALFLRNQHELNHIRAQLNAPKGKKLANPWRGGFVEGRTNKKSHTANVTNYAHKVFGNMSKPILAGPSTGVGPGGRAVSRAPPPPPLRKAWVAAISSNLNEKKFNMTYRSPKVENGKPIVVASEEALDLARSRWSEYLVGYFLEGRLPFPTVEGIAKRMWANQGLVETLSFNKEFFLFKFPNESSRKALLDHGPFLFAGRPLILQHWSPSLKLYKECHSKIPLWVKIHNIPLAMWNPIGLGDIASAIGNPLYVDNVTETLQRLDFARICIEVDASTPLLNEITLQVGDEMIILQVEYQWRPKRCPSCRSFGHICKPIPTTGSAVTTTVPAAVSTVPKPAAMVSSASATATTSAAFAAGHVCVGDLALAPLPSAAGSVLAAAATDLSRPGGLLSVQNVDAAAILSAAVGASIPAPPPASVVSAPAVPAPVIYQQVLGVAGAASTSVTTSLPKNVDRAGPAPAPVLDRQVEGLDYEFSDEKLEYGEDGSEEESMDDASQYEAPLSPKTRGQKARSNLILQPPRGSSQRKKKKKGKRAKR